MKCDKCLTHIPEDHYISYAVPFSSFHDIDRIDLCFQCNKVYDNRTKMLREFLKDDYGTFPIHEVSKNMIEARKLRSEGKGCWT
jgi:hypothetical protein